MKYDISLSAAPAMPKAGKDTNFMKIALSQASKNMQNVLIPMFFPSLSARLKEVSFVFLGKKY